MDKTARCSIRPMPPIPMTIRPERPDDRAAIRAVLQAAFPTSAEADLVEVLRDQANPILSLVAEADTLVLGHILFSPVTMDGHPTLHLTGLGPLAILPTSQSRGVGTALVHAGLARCRARGDQAVVVLGHPRYYPRFGFQPSNRFGIHSEFDVPPEVFMVLELEPDSLQGAGGLARYHPAFGKLASLPDS